MYPAVFCAVLLVLLIVAAVVFVAALHCCYIMNRQTRIKQRLLRRGERQLKDYSRRLKIVNNLLNQTFRSQ